MRKLLVSLVFLAVAALPMHAHGGNGGRAGRHGFSGHHGFRGGHHRLSPQPFFAWGTFGWVNPVTIVVVPQLPAALPSVLPPADPKFVFPPTPSAPSPDDSHTVIVQRGSRIEVQSFRAAR